MTLPPRNAKASARTRWLRRYWRYELMGLGMIAAIWSVPALLNQGQKLCACKNPASEGRAIVGAMGRAQQAYLLENAAFGASITTLTLGIPEETDHYAYAIELSDEAAFHFGRSRSPGLSSFVAGVFLSEGSDTPASSTPASSELIVCASNQPEQPIAPPLNAETCAPGSTRIR